MRENLDCRLKVAAASLAAWLILISVFAPLSAAASMPNVEDAGNINAESNPFPYDISPSSGVQGKEYDVLVTSNQCFQDPSKNPLTDFQLSAPGGSGITVTNSKGANCRLTAHLSIAGDASVAVVKLRLNENGVLRDVVDFTVTAIAQGPIPPGLNGKGAVDVMWSVLPDGITNDNFGGKVAKQFFCVEVTVGNDSGFDLQLASIGFTLPYAPGANIIPNSGYRTVRGSLEAYQKLDARNFVVNGLKVLGPILTGFVPFFHVVSHKANYSEAVNIISNPLEKGLENFWPDIVPAELDRLADQTFRDDVSVKTIIPNNVQSRILTFVPKRLLFPKKNNGFKSWVKKCPAEEDKECRPDNPQDVMTVLGQAVIVGREINYVNRVRVVNTPFGASVTDHTISGKVTDACGAATAGVTMTLSATDFVSRTVNTAADGTYSFPNVPDGRNYTVTPSLSNATFSPSASDPFPLNDTKVGLDFSITAYVITGKITTKDGQPLEEQIALALSGGGLSSDLPTTANLKGEFTFVAPNSGASPNFKITGSPNKYTVDGSNPKDWNCTKRDASFVVVKKQP